VEREVFPDLQIAFNMLCLLTKWVSFNASVLRNARPFTASAILTAEKEEGPPAKFKVNSSELTYKEIVDTDPQSRSVAHWQVLVDWELQKVRPYVIIDPFDPTGLLYLSSQEYLVQSRTLGSMNAPFIVVARPGSAKPEPIKSSKTSPSSSKRVQSWAEFGFDPITWRKMKDLRTFISRNVDWGKGDTVKVNDGNIMGLVFVWTRQLLHYLHTKKPGAAQDQFFGFGKHLQEILRKNGPDFLIKRLKILLFALYSYVGGNPLKTTEPLGQRVKLSNGLPSVFPRELRESVRSGSLQRVRVWASLLNIYKYLQGTHGAAPLDTIGAPPFQGDITSFQDFVTAHDGFFALLEQEIGEIPGFEYESAAGKSIVSAGANTSCSLTSIPWDAVAWSKQPDNLPLLWYELNGDRKMARFMKTVMVEAAYQLELEGLGQQDSRYRFPQNPSERVKFLSLLREVFPLKGDKTLFDRVVSGSWTGFASQLSEEKLNTLRDYLAPWNKKSNLHKDSNDSFAVNLWLQARRGLWSEKRVTDGNPITGRLAALPEAAGKVRVVAICDYFSQVALFPLHKYLFSLLRQIPTDATFDQEGAVQAFAARGHKNIFSYDLKSATDLIPWQLYKPLMEILVGGDRAELWLRLLRDRDFYFAEAKPPHSTNVRYTRGQPMGAYSSWALLALVHHALVQYAARLAGYTHWFQDYLVLGDDIVIGADEVGKKYLEICELYGITVGLPKSLISNKGLMNFASQTVLGTENISPISFKEELNSNSWERRLEFARRIDRRWGDKHGDTPASLRRVLTYAQWQALQGELQGKEWKYTLGFVLFILQQPFKEIGCHIGKITSWLGLLCPELKALPGELVQELEDSLKFQLFRNLNEKVQSQAETCMEILRTSFKPEGPTGDTAATGFKAVWTYLGREVFIPHIQNNIYEPLMELSSELESYNVAFRSHNPTTIEGRKEVLPTMETLIELWEKASRIPKVDLPEGLHSDYRQHIINMLKVAEIRRLRDGRSLLKSHPNWDILPNWLQAKDSLHAPLREVSVSVARVLGVKLPVFAFLHRRLPASWRLALRIAVGDYLSNRIQRDASPHMLVQAATLDGSVGQGISERPSIPEEAVNSPSVG
jgi:hypothetical protein